jgi:undecaprenyl-diphosphatase
MYLRAFMLVLFTNCALFVKELIKDYICRPRPEGSGLSTFSFPSGHCTFTMCFCGIIIYLIYIHVRSDFWRNCLIFLFGAWIFMMGVSRMWLGAHFLSDVLAGMFLGFFFANLFIILDKSISR